MEQTITSITEEASDFVFHLMKLNLPGVYVYHNYRHTTEVVEFVRKLCKKSDVSEGDTEIVTLAAWFHDTGYIEKSENHEEVSAEIASKFLKEKNYPEDKTFKVIECIKATKYPTSPKNLLEEIICDADLYHIGTKDYEDKSDLLRVEWEKSKDKIYTEQEWLKLSIDFLSNHKFYTKHAKKNLEETKLNSILKLQKSYRKRIEKIESDKIKNEKIEFEKLKLESKKDTNSKADRGIETMFRNTVRTHVEFSGMADNKANIMISVNTLIIGGIVTLLLRKLDSNPQLIIPTLMLVIVSLVCIVFGVLVTRPNITSGKFTNEDIKMKRANLLFFGNFFNMELKEFQWGMNEMMNDKEFLYGSMIKDFYFLGQVLGRKYKYLRICYTIFMYGLIASVIAYIIAFMYIPVQDFDTF
jgi:HD superfamily phosphodiesterase